ncbi:uncharacterized protein METZ01_LOCUS477747 [marine metagenome]|uniref:Uncharacterized protein n=1 Tax=marine metagenome TaxID=408172 RepID=A0A383BYJ3_9ZZZZ
MFITEDRDVNLRPHQLALAPRRNLVTQQLLLPNHLSDFRAMFGSPH